jgi:hypothetical protein
VQRHYYFAYGSNMNPTRVAERGLQTTAAAGATLAGMKLGFDKCSRDHAGQGHASIGYDPGGCVEGVLYQLASGDDILRMDAFEATPFNYSRDLVRVDCGCEEIWAWTYFANPAVIVSGLRPSRAYLDQLLAGRPYLSHHYYQRLVAWPCHD